MIFIIVFLCLLAVFVLVILESLRELNHFKVTRYSLDGNDIPKGLKGKKIVFISDYHEACNGKLNTDIINAVKNISPDYIFIGGDMLNGHDSLEGDQPSIQLVNELVNICPLYYAYGNHEKRVVVDYYNVGAEWDEYLSKLDSRVNFLINDKAYLNGKDASGGVIYGLDIPIENYGRIRYPRLMKRDIDEMLGKKPDDEYAILLGHTPDFIEGYSEWGADLVLSGHFHGGLVRLPVLGGVISPRLRLFPKYDYGQYEVAGSRMITTNGLGQHSLKIRINNIPEIVLIEFN